MRGGRGRRVVELAAIHETALTEVLGRTGAAEPGDQFLEEACRRSR